MSALPVDVLAVMDRVTNLLPDKACCGQYQWSGCPEDAPECCADPINPQDELREVRAAVAELIEAAQAAVDRSHRVNPKADPARAGKAGVDALTPEARAVCDRVEAALVRCTGAQP